MIYPLINILTPFRYPDVSATGQNFAGFFDGQPTFFAGTSVSAPVFAALVARINSARLDAGKATVGFLNPTFYEHPEVFNDIVAGYVSPASLRFCYFVPFLFQAPVPFFYSVY